MHLRRDPPRELEELNCLLSQSLMRRGGQQRNGNRSVRSRFGHRPQRPTHIDDPKTATQRIGDCDHQRKLLEWRPLPKVMQSASALGKVLNDLLCQAWSKSSAIE